MIQAMWRRFAGASWLTAAAALLVACGGSGSSGFDRGGVEAEVIDRALEEGRCLSSPGDLFVCPSGAAAPGPAGGEPGPAPEGLRIAATTVGFGLDCRDGSCGVQVALQITALPPGAEIRIAGRSTVDEPWRVGPPLALQLPSDGSGVVPPVGVELGGGGSAGAGDAQLAVLVFLPPTDAVPASVEALRETGAVYAFIFEVAPVPADPRAGLALR